MGKHIQLRYMIRLNSMYQCIFRLIYHKRILNVLREVVRSYALSLTLISYSLKRLSNRFVSWLLVAYCNTRGYNCYLSIKTRCVGFRLHTSTCVFPSINILPVNIKLLIKLFQVVR